VQQYGSFPLPDGKFCPSAPELQINLNEKVTCDCLVCADCIHNFSPLLKALVADAAYQISHYKRKLPHIAASLDGSILIIEDEEGALMYHQGDLSFIMPAKPTLKSSFARQLNADIRSAYRDRQMAVWDLSLPDLGVFRSKCGRNGLMYAMYVRKQRFTFTVFLHRSQ